MLIFEKAQHFLVVFFLSYKRSNEICEDIVSRVSLEHNKGFSINFGKNVRFSKFIDLTIYLNVEFRLVALKDTWR